MKSLFRFLVVLFTDAKQLRKNEVPVKTQKDSTYESNYAKFLRCCRIPLVVASVLVSVLFFSVVLANASSAVDSTMTATSDGSNGSSFVWQDPGNVFVHEADNSHFSHCNNFNALGLSQYLITTGLGFSIPLGSTINGIQVDVNRRTANKTNVGTDGEVVLMNGSTATASKATTAYWPKEFAYVSYGGSSDNWGHSWTVAEINSSTFGFRITAKCVDTSQGYIDADIEHIQITVYYTLPSPDAAHSTITPATATITADGTSTQVLTVQARDSSNYNLTWGGSTVLMSKTGGGTLSAVTDNGNGTYTATLTAPTATGSATVTATLGGVSVGTAVGASQSVVTFAAGALDHFVVTTPSSPQTAGTAFAITTITAQDVNNNTVTSFTGTVDFTETGGGAGGTVSPSTSSAFAAGVRSGQSVTLSKSGTLVTITVTDHAGTGKTGVSGTFTVNPGAIASYVVSATTPQTAGTAFTTTVTAKDANNNTVTTDSSTVVTMTGTGSVQFDSNGDGTFGDYTKTLSSGAFTISTKDNTAETIAITATSTGGKTGTSSSIVINAGGTIASYVVSATTPQTAGAAFTTTVTAKDANNNTVTSDSSTLVTLSGTGSVQFDSNGNGTFGEANDNKKTLTNGTFTINTRDTVAQTITITATDANSKTGTSGSIVVNPAAASQLVFTTSPFSVLAGVTSPTITVQRQDAYGNPNTADATRTVTLASTSGGTKTFTPASPLTISSGSSSVSFTYSDTQAGTPTITAASTSPTTITPATQTETITPAGVPPVNGLVSYWAAENNALDCVGGNNGSFSYNTYAAGNTGMGQAFSLPGNSTSYVNVPYASSLDLTTAFTVSAWIYWDGLKHSSDWMPILAKSPTTGSLENYSFFWHTTTAGSKGQVQFESYISGARQTITSTADGIPLTTWTHIAATYNGATLTLYVNGASSGTPVTGLSGSARTGSDPFKIGYTAAGSGNWWFGGRVDEVRLYSRALSSTEVGNLMSTATGPVSPCASTATASPSTNVTANGSTASTITVTALDANNNPISGQTVTLSVSGTGNAVSTPAVTGADGKTTATLTSTKAETKTITVTIGSTQISAQPTVAFVAGGASQVKVETAADGSGSVVGAQNITAGNSITVYAITRDANGNYVGNPSATWSLINKTGGVANSDLTPTTGSSATFTGNLLGSANIQAVATFTGQSGLQTVVAGAATQTRVETAANGSGSVKGAGNVTAGSSITVYAIARDAQGNFVGNPSAAWSLQNITPNVVSGDLVAGGGSAVFTGHLLGSANIQAVAVGSGQSGLQTVVAGAATQTRVETAANGSGSVVVAGNVTAGSSITVYAITRDAQGNFVGNPSATWSLQNVTGNVVSGDLVAGSGSAVFTGHLVGSANIRAVAGGFTGQSGLQTVVAGTASKLAFTTQPGNGTGGSNLSTQPVVTVQDANGNTVTGTPQNVTVAIQNNPSSGTLSGPLTVAVNTSTGQATFSALSIDKVGTGYTLTATGNTVSTTSGVVLSTAFNITAGALDHFKVEAAGGGNILAQTAGTVFYIQMTAQDAGNNTVTTFVETVTLSTTAYAISPTTSDPFTSGVLTNQSVTVTGAGIGETITATDGTGKSGTSNAFDVNSPTAVKLISFTATEYNGAVLLQWRTGYEVSNLGFHVYKEEGGQSGRLTPEIVAGSALLAGRTALTAGRSYSWWDTSLSDQPSAISYQPKYYLEDIDLSGKRTIHGPVEVKPSAVSGQPSLSPQSSGLSTQPSAKLLSEIGKRLDEKYDEFLRIRELKQKLNQTPLKGDQQSAIGGQPVLLSTQSSSLSPVGQSSLSPQTSTASGGVALKTTSAAVTPAQSSSPLPDLDKQQSLAANPAVKISVKEEGWYRISQPELLAAGLNPNANPQYLRLFVDGIQQAIRVIGEGDGHFDPQDAVEFYGTGLDTPSTDTRVYWLIVGSNPGKRIQTLTGQGKPGAPASFQFTVQDKPRTIYFVALKNGDAENFFGPVISTTPADEILSLRHLDPAPPDNAVLQVALQGVTDGPHQVKVLLNNAEVGTMVFTGMANAVATYTIAQAGLQEGDNLVSFVAQGGDADISLVDYLQLTYWHTYAADDDVLKFTAQGGKRLSVSNFSTQDVRVVDITDPTSFQEVTGSVNSAGAGYSITFGVPGKGQRTLFAFTDARVEHPATIKANQPSAWHRAGNKADLVIITHGSFLQSLGVLETFRESQGWKVALIDVEDLYDEFSFGAKSPQALKDFLSLASTQWKKPPRFVLLAGGASFDPRNYLGMGYGDLDFVPTKPVETVQMETPSDDWFVDFNGDGLPEMAIGRLPVRTTAEADAVVSKITGYEGTTGMNVALLVADVPEDFDFEAASLEVKALLPSTITAKPIFRADYPDDAQAKQDLLNSINQGPLLVNYTGHGSMDLWRGELLISQDAAALTNGLHLPLVASMTCLNGLFDDPYAASLAEALLNAGNGGAVAVWASSGLTEPDGQVLINKELIRQLFNGQGLTGLTIGEATMKAKAATTDMDVRKTWILFGDPTTKLKQ